MQLLWPHLFLLGQGDTCPYLRGWPELVEDWASQGRLLKLTAPGSPGHLARGERAGQPAGCFCDVYSMQDLVLGAVTYLTLRGQDI